MKFGGNKTNYYSGSGGSESPTDLRSFLGEGTDINGEVKFTEIMRVDAAISGTINSDQGSLLVMERGRVKATIQAGTVEVSGIVEGTITAKNAVRILTSDANVRAVFINIFGGILRCDILSEGLVAAVRELDVRLPIVIRMEGTNVETGKQMLRDSGLNFTTADAMDQAAAAVVALAAR